MGMDIDGLNPSAKAGEYIRFSVWRWPPILMLCQEAVAKFDLGIDTQGWEHNDAKGCRDSEKCIALAGAIDNLLKDAGKLIKSKGTSSSKAFAAFFGVPASFEVSQEDVQEFCTFLRACGGFEIH